MPGPIVKKQENQQDFINQLAGELGMEFGAGDTKGSEDVTLAPATDPPDVGDGDEFETDPPATDPPGGDEDVATTAPPADADDEEEFIEMSSSEFNKLVDRMNEMGKKLQETPGATATTTVVKPTETEAQGSKIVVTKEELHKLLLTEDELDRVVDEPQLINKAFERLVDAMAPSFEAVSRLPSEIETQVNNLINVKDVAVKFYEQNPDMASNDTVRQLVQMRFERQAASMTGTGIDEMKLLNGIADSVRKDLGWEKPKGGVKADKGPKGAKRVTLLGEDIEAVVKRRKKTTKPTLPGASSGRRPSPKGKRRKGEAGKIDDLLKELGGLK